MLENLEGRIVLPGRMPQIERRRTRYLTVGGNRMEARFQIVGESLELERSVEDKHSADRQWNLALFQVEEGSIYPGKATRRFACRTHRQLEWEATSSSSDCAGAATPGKLLLCQSSKAIR